MLFVGLSLKKSCIRREGACSRVCMVLGNNRVLFVNLACGSPSHRMVDMFRPLLVPCEVGLPNLNLRVV